MLFLIMIGTPCSGPLVVPLARSASSSAAMLIASGLTSVTQLRVPLTSLILAMYAYTLLIATYSSMAISDAYIDEIDTGKFTRLKPSL